MFNQMPTRVQQRLANALDNKRVLYTDYDVPEEVPFYDNAPNPSCYARTGVSTISFTAEGEGLGLILTFQCTVPWVVYRALTHAENGGVPNLSPKRACCGEYLLKLRVHVFGCKLDVLAAEPLTARDSAVTPLRALQALETHYLKNTGYLWRELFD